MLRATAYGLTAVVALGVAACDRQEEPIADTGAAAEVVGWSPEAEMRATLSDLVHAQTRFYEEHGSFTMDVALLIENYDFVPVGDATVTVEVPGDPSDGYLAVALHPLDDQSCEIQHTVSPAEGRLTTGEITCEEV